MRKVFISYRRAEAEYAAGALGRELRRYFGDEQVFRDKEDVGGGVAWKRQVLHEIDRDAALLILIGPDWANIKDAQGKRRLDDPEDAVRLEIADGIRDGAAILPVLLENAQMPEESDLPPDLRQLADVNALKLRDGDWDYDLKNILRTLERSGFKPANSPAPVAPPVERHDLAPVSAKVTAVKVIVGGGLMLLGLLALGSDDLTRDGHIGVMVFSIVGIALGIWAWRDRSTAIWRTLGIVVSVLSGLGFFAAIGGMGSAPEAKTSTSTPAAEPNSPRPGASNDSTTVSASTLSAPTVGGLAEIELLRRHALVRYNPALWRVSRDVKLEPGSSQYEHASGEVFFKIVSERLQIGLEKLAEIGFENAHKVDPGATITRTGSRRINGLDTVFREIEANIDGIPLTFYIHYYSDSAGSIQLVGWTGRSLLSEHRSTIEEFVSGFQLAGK